MRSNACSRTWPIRRSGGGVCGRLVFVATDRVTTDEGAYWAWETRLKIEESRVASYLDANGAIYPIFRKTGV